MKVIATGGIGFIGSVLVRLLIKEPNNEVLNVDKLTYAGHNEKQIIEVVYTTCNILDELAPKENNVNYRDQVSFVTNRPGHDFRYAIDISKIKKKLDWMLKETFETGIEVTIEWYLNKMGWVEAFTNTGYNLERLGTKG